MLFGHRKQVYAPAKFGVASGGDALALHPTSRKWAELAAGVVRVYRMYISLVTYT